MKWVSQSPKCSRQHLILFFAIIIDGKCYDTPILTLRYTSSHEYILFLHLCRQCKSSRVQAQHLRHKRQNGTNNLLTRMILTTNPVLSLNNFKTSETPSPEIGSAEEFLAAICSLRYCALTAWMGCFKLHRPRSQMEVIYCHYMTLCLNIRL